MSQPYCFKIVVILLKRCTTIFIFLVFLYASSFAKDTIQSGENITISLKKVPLKTVFNAIEEQTGVALMYDLSMVNDQQIVTINIQDADLNAVLEELFRELPLEWSKRGDVIRIMGKREIEVVPKIGGKFESQGFQNLRNQIFVADTIIGTVTDQNGEPLIGVNVLVKGVGKGTATDFEGDFKLGGVDENAVLVFSYVGYKTREIILAGRSGIKVILEEDSQTLDEVVVVGYGTVKKSDLTGAVGTIDGDYIAERRNSQISNTLQGASSGVMVTRNSGDPGSSASIRIRGITTIGNSNPLVIVDGVPVGSIDEVNPNDVDNISILKDAASASIYGSRAAAGVILITTKRSKSGELSLNYDYNYGIETPTERPEVVDITRYMEMNNEFTWNDQGNTGDEYPVFSQEVIENYHQLHEQDPNQYPITDWEGLTIKDMAPTQRHNLSISGGSNSVKVLGSLSYQKSDGLYAHRKFEQITSRINTDVTIKKDFLNAKMDFFLRRNEQERPVTTPGREGYMAGPVYPAMWTDGRVAGGKNGDNPYGQIQYGGIRNQLGTRIGGKFELSILPFDALTLKAVISPSLQFYSGKSFATKVPYYDADDPTQFAGYLTGKSRTNLAEARDFGHDYTMQFLAKFDKEFNDHSLNVMGGYEEFSSFTENLGASRDDYEFAYFPYLSRGPLDFRDNNGGAFENAYRSAFGRIIYNFGGKYLLQGNMRFDGSSRFHRDYRWGFFPSLSAGWVVSNESFWGNNKTISFFKLRGSYGTLGNERIGNYPYQPTIGFQPGILFFDGSEVISTTSAAQIEWAIQNITWEKTETFNLGIDAYFLDNRLQVIGDIFRKNTSNMLLELEIPDFIGFNNPNQNAGRMSTRGWDVEIKWRNSIGKLDYSISGNLFDSRSLIEDLSGTEFKGSHITAEGTEYNEWFGYKTDGIFQDQDEIDNSPVISSAVRPGDVKFVDISGPNGEPDGIISPDYDRIPLGGSLPRYQYGMNFGLEYKNFSFSLVVQGVGKQNASMNNEIWPLRIRGWYNAPQAYDGNYWSVYNDEHTNLQAQYPRLSDTGDDQNFTTSDFWLMNGAYLRIKNINIGYIIPQSWTEKLNIRQIRLYSNISDLYSFDNFLQGYDAEASSTAYPITTTILFGASIKL